MNQERKNIIIYGIWLVIIIYPFLFLWQGLSFSDDGCPLTNYQLIFSDPQSISNTFGTWGANVIGGVWLLLFGGFGLIGLRFAGALVSIMTVTAAYFIFKEYIEQKILLIGILISFVFTYHFLTVTILGYNNLSVLFFVIAILLLTKGLKSGNNILLFMAGFILSFNVFVRLPNIFGLLFVFAITFNTYIKGNTAKTAFKQYCNFVSGAALSLIIVYYVMKTLGHDYYYIESIRFLMSSTGINHGPYNLQKGLLFPALKGYLTLFVDAGIMFLLVTAVVFFCNKIEKINIVIKLLLITLLLIMLYYLYNFIGIPIGGRVLSLLTAACYVVLAVHIFTHKKIDKNLSVAAFLMLMLFIIIPLGSGAGFVNSVYIVPIAFSLVIYYMNNIKGITFSMQLLQKKDHNFVSFSIRNEILEKNKKFVWCVFILYALVNAFAFSYDEVYTRFALNKPINNKSLKGIYTTKEKAVPLNELIAELPNYVKKGDTLLVAWIAPIIYYMTETKPFFPHPWTEIYSKEKVMEFFENAQDLPVIVRYNYSSRHIYDDVLSDFLIRNAYEEKWHNNLYKIYTPVIH